ncbi:hypothetical protein B0H19DRAFT_1078955 [Mycena capillaripes]|nr:hypothetical protein B0H19DRAFT_1078955 [Mycena capillaripes]
MSEQLASDCLTNAAIFLASPEAKTLAKSPEYKIQEDEYRQIYEALTDERYLLVDDFPHVRVQVDKERSRQWMIWAWRDYERFSGFVIKMTDDVVVVGECELSNDVAAGEAVENLVRLLTVKPRES